MKSLSASFAVIAVITLSACGFHLRGYNAEAAAFTRFWVSGPSGSQFVADIKQGLRTAGANEAASRSAAEVVVEVLDERNLQRAASTTGNARVAEYELDVGAYVSISDGAGAVLSEPQWISRIRVYRIDRDNLTGNSQEQALVLRELRADVTQAVLRTVNAVARNSGNRQPATTQTTDAG